MLDFRSDTVTMPTAEMRQAMLECKVGDDVYADDPTVNHLEELAAYKMGKEAALLVTSGTMGNIIAVMAHTKPGDEVILSRNCHIVVHEVGGAARLAGVNFALTDHPKDFVTAENIRRFCRDGDIHHPDTGLVCLENALGNGCIVPLAVQASAFAAAKDLGLPLHLDGARIFNAATAMGVDVKEVSMLCDTLTFCLSKGLAAPIGSVLCGSADFIQKARKLRKMLGSGMRQAGVIAAPGVIAIEKMAARLHQDHDNAKTLAAGLSETPGIEVAFDRLDINMVFFKFADENFNHEYFVNALEEQGIKAGHPRHGEYRFVTHNDITTEDVNYCISCVRKLTEIK